MMFTNELFAFIQSRSFGIACTTRRWNTRLPSSGSAAIRVVSRMTDRVGERVAIVLEVGCHGQHHDQVGREAAAP
jgi:hypothetical protein